MSLGYLNGMTEALKGVIFMTDEKLQKLLGVKHKIRQLEHEIKQINKYLINGIKYTIRLEIFENTVVDVPMSLNKMILQEILYKKEWQLKQLKKYFEEA